MSNNWNGNGGSWELVTNEKTNKQTKKLGRDDETSSGGLNEKSKHEADIDFNNPPFSAGDHIYIWRRAFLVPRAYEHHAIVLNCWLDLDHDGQGNSQWAIKYLHFDRPANQNGIGNKFNPFSSMVSVSEEASDTGLRTDRDVVSNGWRKVEYTVDEQVWMYRCPGTCNLAKADKPALILQRAEFLLNNPNELPPYGCVTANSECMAVWCVTGTWKSFRTIRVLGATSRGAKIVQHFTRSYAVFAAFAAHDVVEWHCRETWQELTEMLNDKFWKAS